MGMQSKDRPPIVEGYEHVLEPIGASPGKNHGGAIFNESFGKITVSGSKAVLSPLPFFVIGCSDGIDAVGLGWGSVEAQGELVTRSTGASVLLHEDEGECGGYLFSPTRGVLQCKCTMKLKAAGAIAAAAKPEPDRKPAATSDAQKKQPRSRQLRVLGADGKPVPGVPLRLRSTGGEEKQLKTDQAGVVWWDGLSYRAESVTAGEDPRNWSPLGLPNPLAVESFNLDAFLLANYGKSQLQFAGLGRKPEKVTFGAQLVARAEDMLPWVGPALLGEFNENPTVGQIIFDTVVTMFPYADQIGDVRDIVAVLIRMSEPGGASEFFNWVTLATCVVGAIPTIGSALRGSFRVFLRDYLKSGGKLGEAAVKTAEQMLEAMRALGIGDPRAVLRISARKLGDEAVAAYRRLMDRLDTVLKFIVANVASEAREFALRLRKMVPLPDAEARIRAAVRWLHDNTLAIIDEGLAKRLPEAGYKQLSDAWTELMPASLSVDAIVRYARGGIPNALQKFRKPALRLTADEWKLATHQILEHALRKRAAKRTFVLDGVEYTIWHGDSKLLYGTYDDLDKLAAYVKKVHAEVHGVPPKTENVSETYKALESYYTDGKRVLDRRKEGFQHHHIAERRDLADQYVIPGAKMMPLDGDASHFVKSKEELEAIYRQLPCVTAPVSYHQGRGSVSHIYGLDRYQDDLKQLRLKYRETHKLLFQADEADELNAVIESVIDFVSN